ncbi:MAG: diphosphomevalonate decarboxylase [Wenzhouxiangellaceae bacterium]|nr:diphosphomevalonate decarboxylase [Wenzhouxiangellaceae bacterium]
MAEPQMATGHALAAANFALIKYWGKRDARLNLPDVGSISITLDCLTTETRLALDPSLEADTFELDGQAEAAGGARVVALLDRFRTMAGVDLRARVTTSNNFPTGAGLASSASGFAALVEAADQAFGLQLPDARKSELARIGSGSAARSIFGGFVEMARGEREDGTDAIARPLAPAEHWPLKVVIAISDRGRKAVGSTAGMQRTAHTSPFYRDWVENQPRDLDQARTAIAERDFDALADVAEASALTMHGLAMSARPGLLYFNATTIECLHRIRQLRADGTPVFFTVDAGPQVKAICLPEALATVRTALADVAGVTELLEAGLGPGAHRP